MSGLEEKDLVAYRDLERFRINGEKYWSAFDSTFSCLANNTSVVDFSFADYVRLAKGVALRDLLRENTEQKFPSHDELIDAVSEKYRPRLEDPLYFFDKEEKEKLRSKSLSIMGQYNITGRRYLRLLKVIEEENPLLAWIDTDHQFKRSVNPLSREIYHTSVIFISKVSPSCVDDMLIPINDGTRVINIGSYDSRQLYVPKEENRESA